MIRPPLSPTPPPLLSLHPPNGLPPPAYSHSRELTKVVYRTTTEQCQHQQKSPTKPKCTMPSSSTPITTLSSTHNDNSSPPGPLTITLQTPFLYQNCTTGQPSSTPLTARQLCRILCPVSSVSTIISPQTLLLGFDSTSSTYDSEGWRQASSVPVFQAFFHLVL